jgi:hypothetical protein
MLKMGEYIFMCLMQFLAKALYHYVKEGLIFKSSIMIHTHLSDVHSSLSIPLWSYRYPQKSLKLVCDFAFPINVMC